MNPRRVLFLLWAAPGLISSPVFAHDAEHPPVEIWSSADGGGQLVTEFDFSKPTEVYETFCVNGSEICLFTSIDPGFLAPTDDEPDDEFFVLADGTAVTLEILSIDAGLTLSVNGTRLDKAGEAAQLGTTPTLHNHPSWQLLTDAKEPREFHISYRLTTDSSAYQNSEVFEQTIVNIAAAVETPTPTPTPAACAGDCDGDESTTVDEILQAVNAALGVQEPCSAADLDGDLSVTVDEILAAVNVALSGCAPAPAEVTLHELQQQIFSPLCVECHNAAQPLGNLDLEPDSAHASLVGVTAWNFAAASAGFLRVDPENPANSFLLVKVENPRPEHGGRMPLDLPPLSATEVQMIRDWILRGAPAD